MSGDRKLKALVSLALARQAEFTDAAQRVYLHLLADTDEALIARACEDWAKRPRGEYAPAMPTAADLRATADLIAQQDQQALRSRALAPMPVADEDGPRFFCVDCRDESSGWRPFWCHGMGPLRDLHRPARAEGSITSCGRPGHHAPHGFVERCACWAVNPVIAARRAKQQAAKPKPKGAAA